MPAWVAFAIPYIFNIATEKLKNILNLYNLITDRLADCGFSLFVALESQKETAKEFFLNKYYNWLRLAIHACPAQFFLIYNYDLIKADDDLKRFIQSDPYFSAWWEVITKSFEQNLRTEDLIEFLQHALFNTALSFITAVLELIKNNPTQFAEEIASTILSQINATPASEDTAIANYLSRFKPDKVPKSLPVIPYDILVHLNPILPFASPQIISHIKAMNAYSKILHSKPCPQAPRQLLEFLDCDVYINNQYYTTVKLDENDILKVTIPKSELNPLKSHVVTFDYAGIQRSKQIGKLEELKLRFNSEGIKGYYYCSFRWINPRPEDFIEWEGSAWIKCTYRYGQSYSLYYWEVEHNAVDTPFYVKLTCGTLAHGEGTKSKVLVGISDGWDLYLAEVADIPYSYNEPGEIVIYGKFPYPVYVMALYNEYKGTTPTDTGVILTRHKAWID